MSSSLISIALRYLRNIQYVTALALVFGQILIFSSEVHSEDLISINSMQYYTVIHSASAELCVWERSSDSIAEYEPKVEISFKQPYGDRILAKTCRCCLDKRCIASTLRSVEQCKNSKGYCK